MHIGNQNNYMLGLLAATVQCCWATAAYFRTCIYFVVKYIAR